MATPPYDTNPQSASFNYSAYYDDLYAQDCEEVTRQDAALDDALFCGETASYSTDTEELINASRVQIPKRPLASQQKTASVAQKRQKETKISERPALQSQVPALQSQVPALQSRVNEQRVDPVQGLLRRTKPESSKNHAKSGLPISLPMMIPTTKKVSNAGREDLENAPESPKDGPVDFSPTTFFHFSL